MTEPGTPELTALQQRVGRLERLLENAYAAVVTVILMVGLIVPFFTEHDTTGDSFEDTPWSIARMVFAPPSPNDGSAGDAPVVVAIIIGFIGLAIVAIAVIAMAWSLANRDASTWRQLAFGRVLLTLGIIGSLVPVIFSAMAASGESNDSPGWGGVVLLIGMLGAIPLFRQRKPVGPGSSLTG